MLNTRQKKGIYPKFFLALHLLNGLNPSPQLKMKFKAQHDDPINGSDMCYQVFGKNAKKCHMHLRHSSHARIPCCLPTPSRKMHPKHKVQVPLTRRKRRRRRLLQPYQWLKLPYFHRRQWYWNKTASKLFCHCNRKRVRANLKMPLWRENITWKR